MNKAIMKTLGFETEVQRFENNQCTICGKPVNTSTEFRDTLSAKEFRISGMCQPCQDSVFDNDETNYNYVDDLGNPLTFYPDKV